MSSKEDPYMITVQQQRAKLALTEDEAQQVLYAMQRKFDGYQELLVQDLSPEEVARVERLRRALYATYDALVETMRKHVRGESGAESLAVYKSAVDEFVSILLEQDEAPIVETQPQPLPKPVFAVAGALITEEQREELWDIVSEALSKAFSSSAIPTAIKNSLVRTFENILGAFMKLPGWTVIFPGMFWFIVTAGLYYGRDTLTAEEWSRGLTDFLRQQRVVQLASPEVVNFVNAGLKDLEKMLFEIQTSQEESYTESIFSRVTWGFSSIPFSINRVLSYMAQFYIDIATTMVLKPISSGNFDKIINGFLFLAKTITLYGRANLPKELHPILDAIDSLLNISLVALNIASNVGYVLFGSMLLFAFGVLLQQIPIVGTLATWTATATPILLAYVYANRKLFAFNPALQEKADLFAQDNNLPDDKEEIAPPPKPKKKPRVARRRSPRR